MTIEGAARRGRYLTKQDALWAIAAKKNPERYRAVHVVAHDDEAYPWCILAGKKTATEQIREQMDHAPSEEGRRGLLDDLVTLSLGDDTLDWDAHAHIDRDAWGYDEDQVSDRSR